MLVLEMKLMRPLVLSTLSSKPTIKPSLTPTKPSTSNILLLVMEALLYINHAKVLIARLLFGHENY